VRAKGSIVSSVPTAVPRVVSNNLKDGSGIVYVQEGTLDRLDEWFAPQAKIFVQAQWRTVRLLRGRYPNRTTRPSKKAETGGGSA